MTVYNRDQCYMYLCKDISKELKNANKEKKYTINKLAQESGLSYDYVENALKCDPGLGIRGLSKLAHAMGCRVQVIFIPFNVEDK